ncbi:hypothetical protein [Dyadobacter psychrotolerans]|uniref:hypothetical protein n=1 Tax=Dyadobacter psychrotolerans TaxID=2541721 RepID=UPI00140460A4|nr:hypothetical protein [Dyadobacter psychrotolerans]
MTIVLKKGVSNEQIDRQIKASKHGNKKPDLAKYFGTLKLKEDPLKIQKSMRDEWD